jgi:hypothetical protein
MIGDATVWLRAAAAGYPFHYVSEPLAVNRLSREQLSWSDESLPARAIATFAAFRFDDRLCEQLRRARLAEAFLARANLHLRRRRYESARADIRRARMTARVGVRGILALAVVQALAIRWISARPWALAPALEAWRRIRPALAHPGRSSDVKRARTRQAKDLSSHSGERRERSPRKRASSSSERASASRAPIG